MVLGYLRIPTTQIRLGAVLAQSTVEAQMKINIIFLEKIKPHVIAFFLCPEHLLKLNMPYITVSKALHMYVPSCSICFSAILIQ